MESSPGRGNPDRNPLLGFPGPIRVVIQQRNAVSLLALLVVIVGGASCSDEPPAATSATPAPVTTTTTQSATTSASLPETTLPETTTTTTTLSLAQESLNYLDMLLAAEVSIGNLVAEVQAMNEGWDNRSESGVSYSETEAAMEAAAERARKLRDAFELIEPSPEGGIPIEHQTATAAVGLMADTATEMLDGLRSTDTGQARRAALVGYLTAFEILKEAINRVALIIGDEGTAALGESRTESNLTTVPDTTTTTVPDTTTTTVPDTTTTTSTEPVTATDLPNPGNSKNCSDFATQAEAQEWFDTYFALYGDVAKIDTNNNGVACELLP